MEQYYIFYNPRNNKVMGESTNKTALQFPYIKSNKWFKNLQNLEIKVDVDKKLYMYVNNNYKYKKKHN